MDKDRILFVYQALSKGGTGSVIFNRMVELNLRGISSRAIFLQHHGGMMDELKDQIIVSTDVEVLKRYIQDFHPCCALHFDTPELVPLLQDWSPDVHQIYEVHTTYAKKYRPLNDLDIMRHIKGVIVPSEFQARAVKQFKPVLDKPIYVVPNGLSENFFVQQDGYEVNKAPIVAWVGRLESHKNWLMFLDIARRIAQADPIAQIWMIGGHRSTEIQHQIFWDTIVRYGLVNRLRWFPEVPGSRMPILLHTVASSGGCLVSTSKGESFGLAVLEAMACGSPIVVANVGGLAELVQPGINGFVFQSGDVSTASQAILKIITNQSLQAKMGEAAQKKAQEFRIHSIVDRFLAALDSIAE